MWVVSSFMKPLLPSGVPVEETRPPRCAPDEELRVISRQSVSPCRAEPTRWRLDSSFGSSCCLSAEPIGWPTPARSEDSRAALAMRTTLL